MKNNLLLALHEKAIKTLEAYHTAEKRYAQHHADAAQMQTMRWGFDVIDWHKERCRINAAIMARLQAYYLRMIDKINQHKP